MKKPRLETVSIPERMTGTRFSRVELLFLGEGLVPTVVLTALDSNTFFWNPANNRYHLFCNSTLKKGRQQLT